MNGLRLLAVVIPALVLGACSYMKVDRINEADLSGDDFGHQLAQDYRDFATFESEAMYDFIDAGYFADKGMAATTDTVLPEDPARWNIDDGEEMAELQRSRQRLLAALAQGAAQKTPGHAARAQVQYDCWVEQEEEGHQFDHIAACRDGFMVAMAATERDLVPAAAARPAPPAAVQTEYLVFFEWDSAEIEPPADDVLDQVAQILENDPARPVLIVGHTDRSGPADYNLRLSERRAEAVADALSERGLDRSRMTLHGEGENEPLVETPDGVREPQNRRVRIDVVGPRTGV